MAGCCPRLEDGSGLVALRARLGLGSQKLPTQEDCDLRGSLDSVRFAADRVQIDGWAIRASEPDRPVNLEFVVGGAVCGHAVANRWRPDLDNAGLAGGSCGFSAALFCGSDGPALRLAVRPISAALGSDARL